MTADSLPNASLWRPQSAQPVPLSDADLAKLGLLVQLEVQCRTHLSLALKAVEGINLAQWQKIESIPFEQLVDRLAAGAAPLDDRLASLVQTVKEQHREALLFRHRNVHGLWAINADTEGPIGLDFKRATQLSPKDLDSALLRVSDFTHTCMACLSRAGALIISGQLRENTDEKAHSRKWMIDGSSSNQRMLAFRL